MRFLTFLTLTTLGLLLLTQCAPNPRKPNKWETAYDTREREIKHCDEVAIKYPDLHTKEDTWLCKGRAQNQYEATLREQN